MATEAQRKYIADLVVVKTKEFKEVKELLTSNQIVGDKAEIVNGAQSIAEITNALDDMQATKLIDVLIATKVPARSRVYSKRRVEGTISALDDITSTVRDWDFNGL